MRINLKQINQMPKLKQLQQVPQRSNIYQRNKHFLIFLFWLLKMDQIFRKVTPQEAYELQSMFPDIRVDYTEFKVYSDNYTQSTKNSCDTYTDNRCEVYIPPKATILKSWSLDGDVSLIKDGAAYDPAVAKPMTPFSGPSCTE